MSFTRREFIKSVRIVAGSALRPSAFAMTQASKNNPIDILLEYAASEGKSNVLIEAGETAILLDCMNKAEQTINYKPSHKHIIDFVRKYNKKEPMDDLIFACRSSSKLSVNVLYSVAEPVSLSFRILTF